MSPVTPKVHCWENELKLNKCIAFLLCMPVSYSFAIEIAFSGPPGDKGQYSIIEISRAGAITTTLHRRIGPLGTDFTKTEINCMATTYRRLGTAEDSPKHMKITPTRWTEILPGTSVQRLAVAACSHAIR